MKRLSVIVRRGDRFILDERRLFPHLRRHEDKVRSALSIACMHYRAYPDLYKDLSPIEQLQKVNDTFYEVLIKWGIYKGK